MDRKIYLLNITVSGIKCIEEDLRIDFYKRTVNKSFDPENYRIKGIFGENGCGKSAVIIAVQIIKDMICCRELLDDSEYQKYLCDVINLKKQKLHLESEFYYCTDPADQVYHYTFELARDDSGRYVSTKEMLTFRKADYPASKVMIAFNSEAEMDQHDEMSEEHKNALMMLGEMLCSNASFSRKDGDVCVGSDDPANIPDLAKFIQVFKPGLKSVKATGESGSTQLSALVLDYGEYEIGADQESRGIRRLIELYPLLKAAEAGRIVFIDEMDLDINEVIFGRIIEFLARYSKGQLCFTAHNTYAMSELRKHKNSIDFLSSDRKVTPWRTSGNYSPERLYRDGMIELLPFNIEAEDFLGII